MNFVDTQSRIFSKCKRAKYLSIIVDIHGRLVGMGWNGKPANSTCDDICFREGLRDNSDKDIICCIHSEINCLLNTPREARFGGTMYVNGIPCQTCMTAILNSNIKRLVHKNSIHGHVGDSTKDDWWKRYGIDIEVVSYDEYEWQVLYGDEIDKEIIRDDA